MQLATRRTAPSDRKIRKRHDLCRGRNPSGIGSDRVCFPKVRLIRGPVATSSLGPSSGGSGIRHGESEKRTRKGRRPIRTEPGGTRQGPSQLRPSAVRVDTALGWPCLLGRLYPLSHLHERKKPKQLVPWLRPRIFRPTCSGLLRPSPRRSSRVYRAPIQIDPWLAGPSHSTTRRRRPLTPISVNPAIHDPWAIRPEIRSRSRPAGRSARPAGRR